jgi:hypothetical protein
MLVNDLEKYKVQKLCDCEIGQLTDISGIQIDSGQPVEERIRSFLKQIGNPYVFRVGQTPVKILFSPDTPTIQEQLLKVIK